MALPFFGIGTKLTFSSPVATAEFSRFAGILSAALSQHHLLEFEIARQEAREVPTLFFFFLVSETKELPSQEEMQDLKCRVKAVLTLLALGELSLAHQRKHNPFLFCFFYSMAWVPGWGRRVCRDMDSSLGRSSWHQDLPAELHWILPPGVGLQNRGKARTA